MPMSAAVCSKSLIKDTADFTLLFIFLEIKFYFCQEFLQKVGEKLDIVFQAGNTFCDSLNSYYKITKEVGYETVD